MLAPAVAVGTALLALAVVPFGSDYSAAGTCSGRRRGQCHRGRGLRTAAGGVPRASSTSCWPRASTSACCTFFALGILAVYGVILAGWSANNKYSLLGALRASAQIISYEIPLGMAVLGVFLIVGSLNPERIIDWQTRNGPYWLILFQPLALVAVHGECVCRGQPLAVRLAGSGTGTRRRIPHRVFGLKLGLMLLSEYVHLVVSSFMISVLFLGGWSLFGLESLVENPVAAAVIKLVIICSARWSRCVCSRSLSAGRSRGSASTN